jgi:enoyl-CoA hydratase
MAEYQHVLYETLDEGRIVRILLNRPDARNAQHRGMLVELNEAFLRAEADDEVRVVILGGTGPMFSSGQTWARRRCWPSPPPARTSTRPGRSTARPGKVPSG